MDEYEDDPYERYSEDMSAFYVTEDQFNRVVEQYKIERMGDYFRRNPSLDVAAKAALDEARMLRATSLRGAFAMAACSVELCIRDVLLEPLIVGLTNSDESGKVVAQVVLEHRAPDRFRELLMRLFADALSLDFENYRRPGADQTLWEEARALQARRNGVVHRFAEVTDADVQGALEVAVCFVETIVPQVRGLVMGEAGAVGRLPKSDSGNVRLGG